MNKKIQMLLVVIIVILLSVSLPVFFVNFKDNVKTGASWEDFATYSKVNNGAFTLTSNKILGTTVYLNDACKIYWDFGPNAITDFWCDFTFNRSVKASNSNMGGFAVSSTLSTWQEALTSSYNTILVTYDVNSAGSLYRITMTDSSNNNYDQTANLDVPFTKYLRFNRTGSTATLSIYNNAARTDLFDTLTITCNTATWRYVYGHLSYGYSSAGSAQTGYLEDLTLNFPGQTYNNPWFNSSWLYCKKIVIDHKKVSGVLNNFPVLIQTSGAEYAFAQPDGDDFVFYAADNTTKYNHEIESFDGTNLVAWVNVTSLNSTVDTVIWMYYGNPTCSNQQSKVGTWNSYYKTVLHMNGTSTIYDSTINNHIGISIADADAGGKIASCQKFTAANQDQLNMSDSDDFSFGDSSNDVPFTFSAWIKDDYTDTGSGQYHDYMIKQVGSSVEYQFYYYYKTTAHAINLFICDASTGGYKQMYYPYTLSKTTFQHVVATYDGSKTAAGLLIYIDGVKLTGATDYSSGSYTAMENKDFSLLVGDTGGAATTEHFNGYIDEVHVMKSFCANASWISTEFNNQNSPSTFMSFGPQQRYDPTTWYDSGWKNCKKITIDRTKVSGDQTNFPVLISNISTDFSIAQSSGNDFVFLNATNQTRYNHEIESFDRSTGTLVAWVNIPYLSSSVDTTIYMYYGNPTCGNQQNVLGTWDSNYLAVFHMSDATGGAKDSRYTHNATAGTVPTYLSAGKIGYAQTYASASSQYLNVANPPTMVGLTSISVEAWIKMSATGANSAVICDTYDASYAGGAWRFIFATPNYFLFRMAHSTPSNQESDALATGIVAGPWYYIIGTWNNGEKNKIYVNSTFAAESSSTFTGMINRSDVESMIGVEYTTGKSRINYLNGVVDEIRVSNIARSAGWINTTYNNTNSPSTFESFGPQQGSPYGVSWYDPSWLYCKKITIDHTKVAANLTNFPILFSNISADFKRAQSTGNDFVFVDAINTTKYNHEIEKFNSSTGELVAWINITYLSCINDTILYLYYGNPTCGNQQNIEPTWDSDYVMVQHMHGANLAGMLDSTLNNNDVASAGGAPSYRQAGRIGYSVLFDGSSYFDMVGLVRNTFPMTIELWWNAVDNHNSQMYTLSTGAGSSAKGYTIGSDAQKPYMELADAINQRYCNAYYSTSTINYGSWYSESIQWAGNTADGYFTLNGITNTFASGSASWTGVNSTMRIASKVSYPQYAIHGYLDEIRISKIVRSSEWLNTTYNNTNSTSTFMTLGNEQTNWYNTTFTYRQKITIDHNKVDADQTNFPVLIKTTMNASRVQSDGDDLLFTSSGGIKLNHEIESYNSTTGALVAWVNVTYVNGGSTTPDTYIYMYYGNSTCSSQQNKIGTWNSDYKMVQHMNGSSATTQLDSTSNANNVVSAGGTPDYQQTAKVGTGIDFVAASSEYLTISDSASLSAPTKLTMSAWIKPHLTVSQDLMGKWSSSGSTQEYGCSLDLSSNGIGLMFHLRDDGGSGYMQKYQTHASNNFANGDWHYIQMIWNGGTSYSTAMYLYEDGTLIASQTGEGSSFDKTLDTATAFTIGYINYYGVYYDGMADEIRVSGIDRSATWFSTEYKNMNDSANFTIFGTEEGNMPLSPNSPPNTPTGLGPTTRQIAPSITIYATATDPNGDAITMYFYNNATQAEIGHQSGASGSNISISWSGLSQGTSYSFYAKAYDSALWSSNSTVCTFTTNAPPVISGLMTENLTDPNRITSLTPYFNWTYTDNNSDTQIAYQIQVGTTQNGSNLWDSGNVTSASTNVKYGGTSLSRSILYYIRIRTYDGYEWTTW